MPSLFPGGTDSFPDAATLHGLNLDGTATAVTGPSYHSTQHGDLGDAIVAVQNFLRAGGMAFIGQTIEWNSATDPPYGEWADEDGRPISKATYQELFALLGNTWNTFRGLSAPAPDKFRIPWSEGLVPVASGGPGNNPTTSARALGDAGGEESHTLSTGELASHTHGVFQTDHTHGPGGGADNYVTDGSSAGVYAPGANGSVDGSTGGQSANVTILSEGGGLPHQNMQPFVVKRKIIRIL